MFLKRFSPRTLFSLTPSSSPSPYSIVTAQCSTSSPSHLTCPYSHSHPDSRISVWWDMDSCPVPPGINGLTVPYAIKGAIESKGIGGAMEIRAFSDMLHLPRNHPWLFSVTGVFLTHVTNEGDVTGCSSLIQAVRDWASQNKPPAHVFIISADQRCLKTLKNLQSKFYNTLLATKERAPVLSANIIFSWDALVRNNMKGCKLHSTFLSDSFWKNLHTFIRSDEGFFIISEANTREDIAFDLKKYGPSDIRSATFYELLLIIDILISDKKWVIETPHLLKAFKLNSKPERSEDTPARYHDEYGKLKLWTDSLLDLYKHELLRVLYPVFVHSCMDLVAKGNFQAARIFFNTFWEHHEMLHSRDLQKLEGVLSPSHLEEMEFPHSLRQSKVNIKICQYSNDILMQYLRRTKSTMMLGIVNEHINFQVSDEAEAVTLIGSSEDTANLINKKEIHWGVSR